MKKYFIVLLNNQNDYEIEETANTEEPLKEITEMEVEAVLKGMSEEKVAGPMGLKSKLLPVQEK